MKFSPWSHCFTCWFYQNDLNLTFSKRKRHVQIIKHLKEKTTELGHILHNVKPSLEGLECWTRGRRGRVQGFIDHYCCSSGTEPSSWKQRSVCNSAQQMQFDSLKTAQNNLPKTTISLHWKQQNGLQWGQCFRWTVPTAHLPGSRRIVEGWSCWC